MEATGAKQFLISNVIEEAKLEQINLSEIEKKMLYFTEVHPSLPDILEVKPEFERDYNSDEYEAKITPLLSNAPDRDRQSSPNQEQDWKNPLAALKHKNHYILTLTA